jgi:ATP-dependent helicase/nuclease subunit A
MTEPLTDQAARNRIARDLDATLFVEAGAGTGKTTELVGRIVALVRSGVPVDQIAAITFTEKAAAELSERVRRELERAATGHERYASFTTDERVRCEAALPDLDRAAIQTLHSFAQRILSLYPLEAGLPPQLRIMDEVEGDIAFRDRWNWFVDELLDDPAMQRPLLRAFTMGLRLKDLERVAEAFHDNWERLEGVEFEAADEPEIARPPLGPALDVAEAALGAKPSEAAMVQLRRLRPHARKLDAAAARISAAGDRGERDAAEVDLLRLACAVPEIRTNAGPKGVFAATREAHGGWIDAARRAYLTAVLPRLRQFALDYAAERRAAGHLSFQDLLVLAVDLLRANGQVRRALHERYQRVLIDEFQDTDPLQVELAALLAGRPGSPPARWGETEVEPGRLFFVGDPKQSIYRFRRADIALYERTRQAFGCEQVPLTTNFRSTPRILEWVNQTFEQLFDRDPGGGVRQAAWVPLQPRPEASRGVPVMVIGGPCGAEAKADEVRREEAAALASAILAAREGRWLGNDRPTRFADMAILLPTRTNSPAIERALADAGIPFRVESRSLVFATQDVRDLSNILAAIDDPTDDVAVVAALRSPAFACRDRELLAHVQAGGGWSYLADVPGASPERVRASMAALRESHRRKWYMSTGALIEEVIATRHMLELAVAGPRPRESWRRLRFVAEQARGLEEAGALTTLRQFVEWLRIQAEEGARVNEGVAVEPDDDAIRIMTIHAAKGLEFDIVFLAGLGIEPFKRDSYVIWPERTGPGGTVEVRAGLKERAFATGGFEAAAERERRHQRLERDRLLYVAATRARERLVISLYQRSHGTSHDLRHAEDRCSHAECLAAACAETEGTGTWVRFDVPLALGLPEPADQPVPDSAAERERWLAERAELLQRMRRAPVVAATAIAHEGEATEEDVPPDDEQQPWRKGRAGTSVGRAVHAVLQTIDLGTGDGIVDAARAQAVAEGIADEAGRVARLVENARLSRAVRDAVASGRFWREVYVGTEVEGATIEGFIDLLFEGPAGLVVVDYKTDSARSTEDIDRAMTRYRLQGAAYAVALEAALGRPVAEVRFVFTEPRAERAIDDLTGAKRHVRERIGQVLAERAGSLTPPAGA